MIKEYCLILTQTARSKIYLVGLVNNGIAPNFVIFLQNKKKKFHKKKINFNFLNMHIKIDKCFSIVEFLKKNKIKYKIINCKSINDDKVFNFIKGKILTKVFVLSLFAGDILKKRFFLIKKKFIHAHAGYLPNYRGSTTNYYSFLEKKYIAATVLYLNKFIDQGKIILRFKTKCFFNLKVYDDVLDSFIRVYVLIKALKFLGKKIKKKNQIESKNYYFYDYYIIHPVLKYISIFKKK
jgi:methionyl-tRNA formyltransferase